MNAERPARAVAVLDYAVIIARENAYIVVARYVGVYYANPPYGSLVSAEQGGDFGNHIGSVMRVIYEKVGYGVVIAVES